MRRFFGLSRRSLTARRASSDGEHEDRGGVENRATAVSYTSGGEGIAFMSAETLLSHIERLEKDLVGLRREVERMRDAERKGRPVRSFADLYGILKGQAEFTAEEIDAAQYRVRWDEETGAAAST